MTHTLLCQPRSSSHAKVGPAFRSRLGRLGMMLLVGLLAGVAVFLGDVAATSQGGVSYASVLGQAEAGVVGGILGVPPGGSAPARALAADVTWNSPLIVQNLGTNTAQFQVNFYSLASGTLARASDVMQLAPGVATPVFASSYSDLASGQYSVVLYSTEPMAGVVNLHASNGAAMSYSVPAANTTSVYFPNVNRKVGSEQWNTPFYLQNASSSSTSNLVVKFYRFSDGILAKTVGPLSLAANATYAVYPKSVDGLSDGGSYSVVATADVNLGGVIHQFSQDNSQVLSLSGFNSGGTKVYFPNLNRYLGAERWTTPFIVQNVGTSSTNLTIEYFEFNTGALKQTVTAPNVQPGTSYVGIPHNVGGLEDGKSYSAVITSSGQPIVGQVQQHGIQGQALNHPGFNGGGTKLYFPNLNRNLGVERWQTPIIVQNVGTGSTNLTIQYYEFGSATVKKTVNVSGLQQGRSYVGLPHSESGLEDNKGYSAVVTSSGQPIVGVANQHGLGSGDLNLGNEAIIR